ncbi:MAG: MalT transcriptional regulator family protein [Planctomycetota bacterium]|jgi:hypothetical protein
MSRSVSLVQQIEIASPCSARWEDMAGDERVRFCGDCRMNVYNINEMSDDDVARLVERTEGRLCARIFRRADGTILTKDCPVGLAAARRQLRGMVAGVAALIAMIFGGLALARSGRADDAPGATCTSIGTAPGVRTVKRWLDPAPPATPPGGFMMGEMVIIPPASAGAGQ